MHQFKFTLSDKDYIDFNLYHLYGRKRSKRSILIFGVVISIILLITMLLTADNQNMISRILIIILLIPGIGISFLIARWLPSVIMNPILRLYIKILGKRGKLPYGQEILLQFNESSMFEKTADLEANINYSAFESVEIGKNAIYLYTNQLQAFIIPFNLFKTPAEKASFLSFIEMKTTDDNIVKI